MESFDRFLLVVGEMDEQDFSCEILAVQLMCRVNFMTKQEEKSHRQVYGIHPVCTVTVCTTVL